MARKAPQTNGGGIGIGSGTNKEKRFSIHDAFEEETDEAIRVYGSTVISTPVKAKARSTEDVTIRVQDSR